MRPLIRSVLWWWPHINSLFEASSFDMNLISGRGGEKTPQTKSPPQTLIVPLHHQHRLYLRCSSLFFFQGMVTKLSAKIKIIPPDDVFRVTTTEQLLAKFFGVIPTQKSLQRDDEINGE